MTHHRITFRQENKLAQTFSVPCGIRISEAAAQAGLPLRNHCNGAGTCKKCSVIVQNQKVLACQTVVEADLDVFLPARSLRYNEQQVFIPESLISAASSALPRGNCLGIALDIGTTTLAAELHDFTGKPVRTAARVNPQRIFGDDVISRIHHVRENPAMLPTMQKLLVQAINEMIEELTQPFGLSPKEITTIVAAGNTVMQSLFCGIDPSSLGENPFRAPVETFPDQSGFELGLKISDKGIVTVFPVFGGFVGGDIVAGVLALTNLFGSSAPRFLLDIGTNGEIVLSHNGELFTAATAAGPAFEGANIEFGTLALPGAIDHVELTSGKMTLSTIAHQPAIGICGSGLIDVVAVLLEQGIILPSGRFADRQSSFELVSAAESRIGEAIVITQRDIRELQLAAGAIKAGIALLLQENGVLPETIETFYVSGGFGQSIRIASAKRIGLLPPLTPERFQCCGNTSLAGARLMLLNPENKNVVHRIIQQSHHCELAMLPQFQQVFAESLHW